MSRFVMLGLVAIVAASLGLALLGWRLSGESGANSAAEADAPPESGMALLSAYRCERAETKRIIVRGLEDGFSPQGDEPIFLHPRLRSPRMESQLIGAVYDQSQPDRMFIDTVELPPNVARGLFVIALQPLTENANDTILIGDMTTSGLPPDERSLFQARMDRLAGLEDWRSAGPLHYAAFAGIRFNSYVNAPSSVERPQRTPNRAGPSNLLAYVRAGPAPRPVDVRLGDDTSVDFIGIAFCEEPPGGNGLTLGISQFGPDIPGAVHLSCFEGADDQAICNPYVGDMPCGTDLPVACFRDLDLPVPPEIVVARRQTLWSGGRVAFAPSVPASRFGTAADVDSYCEATVGRGWRVATYHDSGRTQGLVAYGSIDGISSRVWIDIRGQPYATCWAH